MKYVIAGFGNFGRLALDRMRPAFPDTEVVVVEQDLDGATLKRYENTVPVREDAITFLVESRTLEAEDIIIPMVPFHLAASYLPARNPHIRLARLPRYLEAVVPNPHWLDDSSLCCSMADFICPDDCSEAEVCSVTGERRDQPLYRTIAGTQIPGFTTVVQRSYQILPGIGGYPMGDLWTLAERIQRGQYIVATSCKCHGILTALER